MRIVVHDYSGHPFQVELSRALARRGHDVTHLFFAEFQTPRGRLAVAADDPATLTIRAVSIGEPFRKGSFVQRRAQEQRVGRLIGAEIARLRPDVVLSSNAPLDTQRAIQRAARQAGARFVFWVQDLYGEAIAGILAGRWLGLGAVVGRYYRALEYAMLRRSDGVVAITDAFIAPMTRAGIEPERISVIENWAPLDEIAAVPADNEWARANGFAGRANIVYAGTIGYKHDPQVLLELAAETGAFVTVFSQGSAAEALAKRAPERFAVKPWVAFADLPRMLAAADLVVAFVEPGAGRYSVPSKVLSYLAAGRPILAAIPAGYLAAQLIRRAQAGVVVEPGDHDGLVREARRLLAAPDERRAMAAAGRAWAEGHFAIGPIADRFEGILAGGNGT